MTSKIEILAAVFLLICFGEPPKTLAQEVRPGIWATSELESSPLPTTGYQAYLVGELHGLEDNQVFQAEYLTLLNKSSNLRDIAIEDKAVYEEQAQTYIDGKANTLPAALCLRAGLLRAIRQLNAHLDKDKRIRIHLIDIDSPATAIHEHLIAIEKAIPSATGLEIPRTDEIKEHGLETVGQLEHFPIDSHLKSELRTIELSIRAYQRGFEVSIGPPKGSPYLEEREQAMASNLEDLVRTHGISAIMVVCGFDHVSESERRDGGPGRDQRFWPLAARLEQSHIPLFSVVTFPLAGNSFWRGTRSELPWRPDDGHLASGETLDKLLATTSGAKFFYVDTKKQRIRLPSQDVSNYKVDAFVLFPSSSPMKDECAAR